MFFRHDRRLHGEISRLVYGLVRDFATAAAGKRIRTAAVVVFQSSGEFLRWNPHWHGLFLEGGFDRQGRFVHLPTVDSSVRIPAGSTKAREALSQYIVPPPISLQKLLVDEGRDAVVYRAPYSDYFRTDSKIFPPTAFLAELLQHLPDARNRLIRCYRLYSSRARGTCSHTPHLLPLAPEGWRHNHPPRPTLRLAPPDEHQDDCSVAATQSRSAWARLIKKVYEVDPLGGSWPRSGQREPPELLSLWPTHEGARHHHRPPAGAQDPAPSRQDRKATTRPGPRLPELTPRSWLHPGDQSVLASRDAQIYGLPRPRRRTL